MTLNQNFVIDDHGKKIGVMLSMKEYKKIIDALEELDDIKMYDKVKSLRRDVTPFTKAIKGIERRRR